MREELKAFWHYTVGKFHYQTPPILTLLVTARCNARCQHCFYWQKIDQKSKTELSLEEIERLSQELGHLEVLLIGGGEPFLRQDLVDIIRLFFENNQLGSVSIATNGLLPEKIENEVKRMLQISTKLLIIVCPSIDGTEKVHDQIRGIKGAFLKATETYRRLRNLQKKYKNLRVRPNVAVFDTNKDNLYRLIDQVPSLFPDNYLLGLSLLRGEPRKKNLRLPSLDELKKLFDYKTKKLRGERSWSSRLLERVIFATQVETLARRKQVVPCESGRLLGVVFENGDVGFCELLPPIGNLKEKNFKQIWQSKKAKELREKIIKKKCFCTHECALFPSLLAHPLVWLRLI